MGGVDGSGQGIGRPGVEAGQGSRGGREAAAAAARAGRAAGGGHCDGASISAASHVPAPLLLPWTCAPSGGLSFTTFVKSWACTGALYSTPSLAKQDGQLHRCGKIERGRPPPPPTPTPHVHTHVLSVSGRHHRCAQQIKGVHTEHGSSWIRVRPPSPPQSFRGELEMRSDGSWAEGRWRGGGWQRKTESCGGARQDAYRGSPAMQKIRCSANPRESSPVGTCRDCKARAGSGTDRPRVEP